MMLLKGIEKISQKKNEKPLDKPHKVWYNKYVRYEVSQVMRKLIVE